MKTLPARRRNACRRLHFDRLEARVTPSSAPDGSLAVQLSSPQSVGTVDSLAAAAGATVQTTSVPGLLEVQGSSSSLAAVSAATANNPAVQYTQPVQTVQATATPNDPEFVNGDQTGLGIENGINATGAWNVTTGSPATVTIADIDTGADYDQPDLYGNIWINQAEIPASRMKNLVDVYHDGYISWADLNNPINIGPGKITDLNGDGVIDAADILSPMILNAQGQDTGLGGWANPNNTQDGDTQHPDDLIGWNFVNNTNNPFDDNGHGTFTAGEIAAMGNNGVGVAGVNWTAQVMVVSFLDSSGNGTDVGAAEAIEYAANHGAKVANASWGASGTDPIVTTALEYAKSKNMVVVAAAGNDGVDTDDNPYWPADSGVANVISVGASQSDAAAANFSNYGANSVDLFAPGVNIESTYLSGEYNYNTGTSMAAPLVTGTVALLEGLHPTWTYTQIINQILATASPSPSLAGLAVTGGLVNAGAAVSPLFPGTATFVGTDTTTEGNWRSAYGGDGYDIAQDGSGTNPSLPSYAQLTLTSVADITLGTTNGNIFPLENAAGTGTIAAAWSNFTSFDLNFDLTDGLAHTVALYAINPGSAERFDVIDDTTGTVLNSQMLAATPGTYLVWSLQGDITIQVSAVGVSSGGDVSGIFFGSPAAGPTVATAAGSSPTTVTGTTATLSALGADLAYPATALNYIWTPISVPAGAAAPTFSVNGTNSAQQTTVTFSQAGTYTFQVTIVDPGLLTVTSSVTVTVAQTLTQIAVAPAAATVAEADAQMFTATATDQFGQVLVPQPTFNWSVASGGAGGTINASGLYTAPPSTGGTDTVEAGSGAVTGTATVTVLGPPTAETPSAASPQAVTGTTTISQAGSYPFQVTIENPRLLTTTSTVTVTVAPTLTAIALSPALATVADGMTQPFTAIASDHFGQALASQPVFTGSVDAGGAGGTINASRLYTAPASGSGTDTVRAQSGGISGTAAVNVTVAAAAFLGTDATTAGSRRSAYRGDGYDIAEDTSANNPGLPSYAQVSIAGASTAGQPMAVTLQVSDPGNDSLVSIASVATPTRGLDQTFAMYADPGGSRNNRRGQQQKDPRAWI